MGKVIRLFMNSLNWLVSRKRGEERGMQVHMYISNTDKVA